MNGNLKSLHLLWVALAANRRYSPYMKPGDFTEFSRRCEHEGITFLTTTLPRIGKALDAFHSTTEWIAPVGFKADKDSVPLFMGTAIKSALSGDSLAVDCVRQLSYVFYKLDVPHDPSLVQQFADQFVKVDSDLADAIDFDDLFTSKLLACMRRLIHRVLANADPLDIRPCHGSGATACRTKGHDKWHKLRYYSKLDAVFHYPDYFFFNYSHLSDEMEKLEQSEDREPRARVVYVPKDSRGPRVISCEPAEMMYIQQGLMRLLYDTIETHNLTRGQINFSDQSLNRRLARDGSLHGTWATMDLSEASDRVQNRLVMEIFPPRWVAALQACRSEETELPDGRIVKLNKFAPMGSSCCFPVEALVFWACAQASIHMRRNVELYGPLQDDGLYDYTTSHNYADLGKFPSLSSHATVHVYGDDIVVPSHFVETVTVGLEKIGLMVNRSKTYSKGPFRESCGGDYHKGCDVTPVKLKKHFWKSHTAVSIGADLANLFIAKFGYTDSLKLISVIEELIGYVFPRSTMPRPGVLLSDPCASNDVFFARRFNRRLQRYEHRILGFHAKVLTLREPNWSELLKKELTRESVRYSAVNPNFQGGNLAPGEYTVPRSVRTKWDWVWLG